MTFGNKVKWEVTQYSHAKDNHLEATPPLDNKILQALDPCHTFKPLGGGGGYKHMEDALCPCGKSLGRVPHNSSHIPQTDIHNSYTQKKGQYLH